MGKKTSWLSTVKRVFKSKEASHTPSNRRRERQREAAEEAEAEGNNEVSAEIVSVEHFSAETSPDATNHGCRDEEDQDRVVIVERERAIPVATRVAAVAAEAAARAVQLAGGARTSRKDRAAVVIQSFYHGYLARRARRALRGLVKLQALVRGYQVRKQAQTTLRCMQSLFRVQALVRTRRLKLATTHRNVLFSPSPDDHDLYRFRHTENRRPRDYHRLDVEEDDDEDGEEEGPVNRPICVIQSPLKDWDGRQQSVDTISADSQSKHEAAVGREKALAYICTHQRQWPPEQVKPQWRWNWLELWMAVEQWEARHGAPRPPPVSSYATATPGMDGGLSEKTVEMDPGRVSPFSPATHYSYHSKDGPVRPRVAVPSYMAATQSARAKVRTQAPPQAMAKTWTRRSHSGNVADSSSSGGGTPMYLAARSPGHIDGVGLNAQRRKHTGYNPDSSCD